MSDRAMAFPYPAPRGCRWHASILPCKGRGTTKWWRGDALSRGRHPSVRRERLPPPLAGEDRASNSAKTEQGFTLIEALVALAILAVASVGLIGATEAHVDSVRGLEARAAAQWVAENRLAELGLPGATATDAGDTPVEMLGHRWRVTSRTARTADPDLLAVHIEVHPVAGAGPGAALDGFIDAGTTTI